MLSPSWYLLLIMEWKVNSESVRDCLPYFTSTASQSSLAVIPLTAMERRSLRMELRRVALAFSSFSSHASCAFLCFSSVSQVREEEEGEDSILTPLSSSA